jgi:hypothetical protein
MTNEEKIILMKLMGYQIYHFPGNNNKHKEEVSVSPVNRVGSRVHTFRNFDHCFEMVMSGMIHSN